MPILKNEVVLKKDWIPPRIVDREEQIKELSYQKEKGFVIIYITGLRGTGKTLVVKKLFLSGKSSFYVNCKEKRIDSTRKFYQHFLQQFIKVEPYWSTTELIEKFREIVKKHETFTLVIDEINEVKDVGDLLYQLSYFYASDPEMEKLRTVAISNDITLLRENESRKIDDSVISRIPIKIIFPVYTVHDLFEILKVHAEHALYEGSYSNEDLMKIAKFIHSLGGNARYCKELLYYIAKHLEEKGISKIENLPMSFIEKIFWKKVKIKQIKEVLSFQPIDTLLALKAIVSVNFKYYKSLEKWEKTAWVTKSMSNLREFIKIEPKLSMIYNEYKKIASSYGKEPVSYRTFHEIVNTLESENLIFKQVISRGRGKGRSTFIHTIYENDLELLEELSSAIDEILYEI